MIFPKVSIALFFCAIPKLQQNFIFHNSFRNHLIQFKRCMIFFPLGFFSLYATIKAFKEIHDQLWNWQHLFSAFSVVWSLQNNQLYKMSRITEQLCPGLNGYRACSLLRHIHSQNHAQFHNHSTKYTYG